jgi:hypothetical protein
MGLLLPSRLVAKTPGDEAHSGHIVLTPMGALVAAASRLAGKCHWERVGVLAVNAPRNDPRIKPRRLA